MLFIVFDTTNPQPLSSTRGSHEPNGITWPAPRVVSDAGYKLSSPHLPVLRSQEAYNLFVARVPRHVTTLARFTALRRLSLLGAFELLHDEVCSRRCIMSHYVCTSARRVQADRAHCSKPLMQGASLNARCAGTQLV